MNILLKMEGILTEYATFVLVMLATFTDCKITRLNVVEGDVASLSFNYSCNSTKVTLQRGNGVHIYNSKRPTLLSSSNLRLRNETDGETCFLHLTINPVTREDQGGYVLFAYKNDPLLFEEQRIWLDIVYPHGKASCSLSEEHIDPEWVRLQCTAPIGNIEGFIMCYQHGTEIPPLNSPQEHDGILSQTLLARVGDLVYCCSNTLDRIKDKCECKDSVWDPVQKMQVTNVTDPCPLVMTVQYPPFSQQPTSPSTKALTVTPPLINSSNFVLGSIPIICLLILVIVILSAVIVYYFLKHRKQKQSNFNQMYQKTPQSKM